LPTPTSTLADDVNLSTVGGGSHDVNGSDPRNIQIQANQSISLDITLVGTGLINTKELSINLAVDAGFVIFGLNTDFSLILDSIGNLVTLSWSSIAPFTAYSPKNYGGSSAKFLPACTNLPGCDGFSISVATLRNLLPANGYIFQIPWLVREPTGAGRRLLQSGTSGQQTYVFVVENGTISASLDILDADLGTPTQGGELILISGALGLFGALMASVTAQMVQPVMMKPKQMPM